MTNPAPPGGDERPPPAPNLDPLAPAEVPPAAMPPPAGYETTERLEPTPAYDALAAEAPLSEPPATGPVGVSDLAPEADYALAPNPTDAGPFGQVKAFAAEKPAAFLGAALAAGWLLGKITSRGRRGSASDDD
jgi:hypothetical protein